MNYIISRQTLALRRILDVSPSEGAQSGSVETSERAMEESRLVLFVIYVKQKMSIFMQIFHTGFPGPMEILLTSPRVIGIVITSQDRT